MIKFVDRDCLQSEFFIFLKMKSPPIKFQSSVLNTSIKMDDPKHQGSPQIPQSCDYIEMFNFKNLFLAETLW